MSMRSIPSYLAVVPPAGKRFRRPRKPVQVPPLARDSGAVASMIQQAEHLEAIIRRLHLAIYTGDELVARALIDRAEIEARYAASTARGLKEGTPCA